jgi:hypothetical protein
MAAIIRKTEKAATKKFAAMKVTRIFLCHFRWHTGRPLRLPTPCPAKILHCPVSGLTLRVGADRSFDRMARDAFGDANEISVAIGLHLESLVLLKE